MGQTAHGIQQNIQSKRAPGYHNISIKTFGIQLRSVTIVMTPHVKFADRLYERRSPSCKSLIQEHEKLTDNGTEAPLLKGL